MRVVNENRFLELCDAGEIQQSDCNFLDGLKIGLRCRGPLLQLQPEIDVSALESCAPSPVEILDARLQSGHLYLVRTVEQIGLSSRIFGLLNTRSTWARLGLDCVGSSWFVSPAFGRDAPVPLVLEVRPVVSLTGFDWNQPVAALLLFEMDESVRPGNLDHGDRFPLDLFGAPS